MESLTSKVHSRKRKRKSHGVPSGCEDKPRKHSLSHLLKVCTEARNTANCDITQNRLTMRMGLLNKGKASHTIIRTYGGGRGEGERDDYKSGWKKVPLYQQHAKMLWDHQPTAREKLHNKENRTVLSPVDVHAADSSNGNLPSSPGLEDIAVFLTEHIDPTCITPSGYFQRVKKRLLEQFKAALQKADEEKENLLCPAQADEQKENLVCLVQTERGLWEGIHKTQHHDAPLRATENAEEAVLCWLPAAKRLEIPLAASRVPPSYVTVKLTDTRGLSSSSGQLGNVKEFWSATTDDGPMHNHLHLISQPLLNITDAKSLLALNDFMCHHAKQGNSATTFDPLKSTSIPSFVGDASVSGPSSSEWTYDLDHGCLKYMNHSIHKNSRKPPVYQTGEECDILDIAEANQTSTDDKLQFSSDHSNDIHATMTPADGSEEQQNELFGGFLSRKNSQGSLDEPTSSWEMHLPKLLLTTVHRSPSPQQKYYRRKVF